MRWNIHVQAAIFRMLKTNLHVDITFERIVWAQNVHISVGICLSEYQCQCQHQRHLTARVSSYNIGEAPMLKTLRFSCIGVSMDDQAFWVFTARYQLSCSFAAYLNIKLFTHLHSRIETMSLESKFRKWK